jgi:hypothetical protein
LIEKRAVEQSVTLKNPQNKDGRPHYSEDHAIVSENQVPIIGPQQFIFWYERTAVGHALESVDFLFKLENEFCGVLD